MVTSSAISLEDEAVSPKHFAKELQSLKRKEISAFALGQKAEKLLADTKLHLAHTPNRLYGPRGWTDICGVREIVEQHAEPSYYLEDRLDFLRFSGMRPNDARELLMRLPKEALCDRQNNAPELRSLLQAAVKYPDLVFLAGYLVGEQRWDERVSVDTIFVRDQIPGKGPDYALFGASTPNQAWELVKTQLGLDGALYPPDDVYYCHPEWTMHYGGWCFWWD